MKLFHWNQVMFPLYCYRYHNSHVSQWLSTVYVTIHDGSFTKQRSICCI